jgi:hypothetical protein
MPGNHFHIRAKCEQEKGQKNWLLSLFFRLHPFPETIQGGTI